MKTHAILATAGAVLMATAATAFAADAVIAPPPAPSAPPVTSFVPVSDWSGFYAGAFGAYNWSTFDTNAVGDLDDDAFSGGAFAGINFQNGAFVYGAEADIGYSDVESGPAEQGIFGSVRARLGYDFNPFLLYGTAGLAVTSAEVDLGGGNDDRNTHLGWTVGVGADAMITENVFGRLEYRYTDYETKTFDLAPNDIDSGLTENSIRAGIGFKF